MKTKRFTTLAVVLAVLLIAPFAEAKGKGKGKKAQSETTTPDAPAPDTSKPPLPPLVPTPPTPPDPQVIQANDALNVAMNNLRETLLKTNSEYQSAVADKNAAQAEAAALRASEGATPDATMAAATKVVEASQRVVAIERDAAANDAQVQEAQARLKSALASHAASTPPK